MNKTRHRYFLYARKSSESEDRQMASIPDQIKEVRRLAKELGLQIVDTITESRSAKAPGRTGFNEMLSRIRKGEADAIICWKLNRLARNPVDGGEISWMLQQGTIQHIQCYGRDYKPSDNVLMMQVELGMANQYVKDLSVDVKRGLRQKAERGWYPSSSLPIGYQHNRNRHTSASSQEIILDSNFPLLKELWGKMLTGKYSIADIKRIGDSKGMVGRTGRPFALNTYHLTFASRFYCGSFQWKDAYGIVNEYQGKHTPMVTLGEYEKVQEILGHRSSDTRSLKHDFPFKGILTCGACGCTVSAERKKHVRCTKCKRKFSCLRREDCPRCNTLIRTMRGSNVFEQIYYRCTHKKKDCSQKYITQDELKRQYLKAIKRIEVLPDFYEVMYEEVQLYVEQSRSVDQKKVGVLNNQISKLKTRVKQLALMRADGELGIEEYQESKEASLREIQNKEHQLRLIQEDDSWIDDIKGYIGIGEKATKIFQTGSISDIKELLSKLGSNHILMDGKVEFISTKPLLTLHKLHSRYCRKKSRFEPQKNL